MSNKTNEKETKKKEVIYLNDILDMWLLSKKWQFRVLRMFFAFGGTMYLLALAIMTSHIGGYTLQDNFSIWSFLLTSGMVLFPFWAFGLLVDLKWIFSIYKFFKR